MGRRGRPKSQPASSENERAQEPAAAGLTELACGALDMEVSQHGPVLYVAGPDGVDMHIGLLSMGVVLRIGEAFI